MTTQPASIFNRQLSKPHAKFKVWCGRRHRQQSFARDAVKALTVGVRRDGKLDAGILDKLQFVHAGSKLKLTDGSGFEMDLTERFDSDL